MGQSTPLPASAEARLKALMAEHRTRQIALLELEGRIVREEDRMGQPSRWDRLKARSHQEQRA